MSSADDYFWLGVEAAMHEFENSFVEKSAAAGLRAKYLSMLKAKATGGPEAMEKIRNIPLKSFTGWTSEPFPAMRRIPVGEARSRAKTLKAIIVGKGG